MNMTAGLPLEGIRIIDLSMVWAGPYATRILADMGAEVIKIESVNNYDLLRTFVFLPQGTERPYNRGAFFNHYNRNKLGITLNLAKPRGVGIFKKLVEISDVVIENYRPDVMGKLGINYEVLKEVKPDIIMVSMPGHGKTGPEKDNYAYGTHVEQLAGLVSITGYPDGHLQRSGISYGDPVAGTMAAGAVATALHRRRSTGKGQYVELAQRENLTRFVGEAIMDLTMNRRIWPTIGNRHTCMAPHGCYRCKGDDAWVTIAVDTDEQWGCFCRALGDPPWAEYVAFADSLSRWKNQDELDRLVEAWTMVRTPHEVMHTLQSKAVAAGVVMDSRALLEDPHLNDRGFWETVTHPDAGTWKMEGPTCRLVDTPAHIRMPPPCFGQHNDHVFRYLLNLTDLEIKQLVDEEIIGTAPLIPDHLLLMQM